MTVTPIRAADLATRVTQAKGRADWAPVEELYLQVSEVIRTATAVGVQDGRLPEPIVGALAVRLGRVAASYSGTEEQFIRDARDVLGQSHVTDIVGGVPTPDLFDLLYHDARLQDVDQYRSVGGGRRRPTPFESVVETSRRLRDLAEIRASFQTAQISSAAVLGGSLSYGRFFNVRGGEKNTSSDTDLLLVISENADLRRIPGILRKVRFIRKRDIAALADRIEPYLAFASQADAPTIFSHKVAAWSERLVDGIYAGNAVSPGYGISFHIASQAAFDMLLWRNKPRVDDDEKSIILDYRTNLPANGIARGFDGTEATFAHTTETDGDNIVAKFRTYDTIDGRYKPGLHQQLVLPNFEARWAVRTEIAMPLLAFKWKILERLRHERMRSPHKVLNLSLSHVRYQTFAPHVRRRTDTLELES